VTDAHEFAILAVSVVLGSVGEGVAVQATGIEGVLQQAVFVNERAAAWSQDTLVICIRGGALFVKRATARDAN